MVRQGDNELAERQLSGGACSTSSTQMTGAVQTIFHPRCSALSFRCHEYLFGLRAMALLLSMDGALTHLSSFLVIRANH